jgi:HK97 gp10 family phage protein
MAKEIVIGEAALQRRLDAIANAKTPEAMLRNLAALVVQNAKVFVPRKTGNLARSIKELSVTATSAQVIANANYAGYVEGGTRPHVIEAGAKGILAWPASSAGRRLSGTARKAMYGKGAAKLGGWAYAMRVNHPGTKPHPFMMPAARKSIQQAHLEDKIVAAWNDAA